MSTSSVTAGTEKRRSIWILWILFRLSGSDDIHPVFSVGSTFRRNDNGQPVTNDIAEQVGNLAIKLNDPARRLAGRRCWKRASPRCVRQGKGREACLHHGAFGSRGRSEALVIVACKSPDCYEAVIGAGPYG